jgi:hypothetical protein
MIGKIGKSGKGFTGTINYLLDGPRGPERLPHRVTWTETRNLFDPDPRRTARYMRAIADASTRVKKPVYHFIISWTAAEAPSPTVMAEIADATCRDLGLDEHQRLYVAHHDTQNPHVHVVVNRIHPTRHKAWKASHDFALLERSMARQAVAHRWTVVPGVHNRSVPSAPIRRPKSSLLQKRRREQKPVPRRIWTAAHARTNRQHLVPHFELAIGWADLEQRLGRYGLTIEPKGQGVVLVDVTGEMKLSSLGKGIRLKLLEKQFGQPWQTHAKARRPNHQGSTTTAAPTPPVPIASPPLERKRRRQAM